MSTTQPDPRACVVALHSLFFSGEMFDDLAAATEREVIAPNHRGQNAAVRGDGDLTVDRLADDVIVLLRNHGQPVHLVGSSMGAYVAAIVAARVPELVLTVVLSAATGDAEKRPEVFAAFEKDLRRLGPEARVERIENTMFGAEFLARSSPALQHWRRHFASLDASVTDAAHQVFTRRALWPDLEAVRCPVLLFAGRIDRAKTPADMQAIADRIGCADPVIFEHSGHTPFVEQPGDVASVLADWWTCHDHKIGKTHDAVP